MVLGDMGMVLGDTDPRVVVGAWWQRWWQARWLACELWRGVRRGCSLGTAYRASFAGLLF